MTNGNNIILFPKLNEQYSFKDFTSIKKMTFK